MKKANKKPTIAAPPQVAWYEVAKQLIAKLKQVEALWKQILEKQLKDDVSKFSQICIEQQYVSYKIFIVRYIESPHWGAFAALTSVKQNLEAKLAHDQYVVLENLHQGMQALQELYKKWVQDAQKLLAQVPAASQAQETYQVLETCANKASELFLQDYTMRNLIVQELSNKMVTPEHAQQDTLKFYTITWALPVYLQQMPSVHEKLAKVL